MGGEGRGDDDDACSIWEPRSIIIKAVELNGGILIPQRFCPQTLLISLLFSSLLLDHVVRLEICSGNVFQYMWRLRTSSPTGIIFRIPPLSRLIDDGKANRLWMVVQRRGCATANIPDVSLALRVKYVLVCLGSDI